MGVGTRSPSCTSTIAGRHTAAPGWSSARRRVVHDHQQAIGVLCVLHHGVDLDRPACASTPPAPPSPLEPAPPDPPPPVGRSRRAPSSPTTRTAVTPHPRLHGPRVIGEGTAPCPRLTSGMDEPHLPTRNFLRSSSAGPGLALSVIAERRVVTLARRSSPRHSRGRVRPRSGNQCESGTEPPLLPAVAASAENGPEPRQGTPPPGRAGPASAHEQGQVGESEDKATTRAGRVGLTEGEHRLEGSHDPNEHLVMLSPRKPGCDGASDSDNDSDAGGHEGTGGTRAEARPRAGAPASTLARGSRPRWSA